MLSLYRRKSFQCQSLPGRTVKLCINISLAHPIGGKRVLKEEGMLLPIQIPSNLVDLQV